TTAPSHSDGAPQRRTTGSGEQRLWHIRRHALVGKPLEVVAPHLRIFVAIVDAAAALLDPVDIPRRDLLAILILLVPPVAVGAAPEIDHAQRRLPDAEVLVEPVAA